MNNTQNIAIVALTISAALLGGLFLGTLGDQKAQAGYASVTKADFIMVPYAWDGTTDLLCVIDIPTRKMNVYFYNANNKSTELINSIELERAFSAD